MKSILRVLSQLTQTFLFQLTVAFGLIIVLMTIALGVGIVSLNQINAQTEIQNQVQKTENLLLEVKVALLEEDFWVTRYVLLNQYQALHDYLQKNSDNLLESLQAYTEAAGSTIGDQAFLADLKERIRQLKLTLAKMSNQMLLANQAEAAQLLQNEFTNQVKDFSDVLSAQHELNETQVQTQRQLTGQITRRSDFLLTTGGIIIAVFTLLSAIILAIVTSRRIASMRRTIVELGQGNYNTRVKVAGKDELSRMGKALNLMAQQVDGVVTNLEARNQELEALQDFTRRLHSSFELRAAAERSLLLAMEVVGADAGYIYLSDAKRPGILRLLAGYDNLHNKLDSRTGNYYVKVGDSLTGKAFLTGQLLRVDNIAQLENAAEANSLNPALSWVSGLYVPMIAGGKSIGVLTLTSNSADHFPAERLRFIETFTGQIATAIQQAAWLENQRETEKLEAVLTMARTAAHELRQPLTVLQAELDLVTQLNMPLDQERLDRMQQAIIEMNDRVSSYQLIVRYETDLSLPDAPIIDHERAVVGGRSVYQADKRNR